MYWRKLGIKERQLSVTSFFIQCTLESSKFVLEFNLGGNCWQTLYFRCFCISKKNWEETTQNSIFHIIVHVTLCAIITRFLLKSTTVSCNNLSLKPLPFLLLLEWMFDNSLLKVNYDKVSKMRKDRARWSQRFTPMLLLPSFCDCQP